MDGVFLRWFELKALMFDLADAAAGLRLPFKQTNIQAARGEQCRCGQASDAPADYDDLEIHLSVEKAQQVGTIDWMVPPQIDPSADVRLKNDDD